MSIFQESLFESDCFDSSSDPRGLIPKVACELTELEWLELSFLGLDPEMALDDWCFECRHQVQRKLQCSWLGNWLTVSMSDRVIFLLVWMSTMYRTIAMKARLNPYPVADIETSAQRAVSFIQEQSEIISELKDKLSVLSERGMWSHKKNA